MTNIIIAQIRIVVQQRVYEGATEKENWRSDGNSEGQLRSKYRPQLCFSTFDAVYGLRRTRCKALEISLETKKTIDIIPRCTSSIGLFQHIKVPH